MSRSGYTDDYDDYGRANLYRANVERALRGKRGQAFLREMLEALDAMPVKALIARDLVRRDGGVCALGAVAVKRGLDVADLDPECPETVAYTYGITEMVAREIVFWNDEDGWRWEGGTRRLETDQERWQRMRRWVASHLDHAADAGGSSGGSGSPGSG